MTGPAATWRVRRRHVEWVEQRITARDLAITATVNRLRLVTSAQLERLHFAELSGKSRAVVRQRVLRRLIDWRVLMALPRRIGGIGHGSSLLVLALDSAGQWLLSRQAAQGDDQVRVRRPTQPSQQFTRHTLATSELYVRLVEASQDNGFTLAEFLAEPAAWVPNLRGGWLKPDAFVLLAGPDYDDHWWIEVDQATEHREALRGKLLAYIEYERRGGHGPHGVLPRVLLTVPDERRKKGVEDIVQQLPQSDEQYFYVTLHNRAASLLWQMLGK